MLILETVAEVAEALGFHSMMVNTRFHATWPSAGCFL